MTLRTAVIAGLVALGLALPVRAESLRVVASIKPVQSLAASVMEGVGAPQVLIKGAGSAHAYALRPSEADALAQADVVFWIGPDFEVFLRAPLKNLGAKARHVALADILGVSLALNRPAGIWTNATAAQGKDGHLWLNPANAKVIVAAIAETLAAADAPNAARYRANVEATAARLDALDADLAAKLAPVQAKPFIVFHDAIHAFEARYGLTGIGAVTANPERPAGAAAVAAIKREIGQRPDLCVFAEPQFEPKLIQALIAGTSAKTGTLDPEGSTLAPGPDLYFNLLRGLADSLVGCLSAS